uniref:Glutamate receptor n=1 Tax=Biomphalaria glabrata TaxID=6526 RepID=A0A2C9JM66_BIOGL
VIFDKRDSVSQRAFERALAHHRAQSKYRDPHFQLNVTVDVIDVTDNFQLASAICRQMTQGVFAILGQKSYQSADIVKSLTSTFRMPFITPSLAQSSVLGGSSSYELHLRPDHTAAVIDVIEHLHWKEVHFLYDSDEGLHRLQHMYKMMSNNSVRWFSMIRFSDITDVHDDLRMTDFSDNYTRYQKAFVLDLSSDEAYQTVLKQIPEVGMNKFGYNYLLTSLDFQSMNLSRFRHGGVNITGFQLLEHPQIISEDFSRKSRDGDMPNSYGLPVHAALAVDGLKVIEEAISGMLENDSDVFRWIFRRGDLYNLNKTKGIPCTTRPPLPWMFGQNILTLIKKRQPQGLSGSLTFDEDGHRKDFSLGVFSMALDKGIQKIGTWSPKRRFVSIYDREEMYPDQERRDANGTKIITSILGAPFLVLKERKDGEPAPQGDNRYEGFSVELANALAKEVGFTHEFRIVADNAYGAKLSNGSWNGMIGELISGVADLAVAPLTITAERERYVDFSKHFMEIGVTIVIKKPQSQRPGVFSFMEPLSLEVWVCIIVAYLTVSIGLFLVSRFSPVEWKKVREHQNNIDWTQVRADKDGLYHNDFSLFNSFWFSMGALMFQGSDTCPRSISGRIIGGAWWFFVLIIISSYTANLAAFLTIERMINPIESADDLLNHPSIKYGAVTSGSTLQFFLNSDVPVYRQMGEYMKTHSEVLVQSNEEGIERVLKSKGKYAFLAESSFIEYINERSPCDTVSVGGKLNNIGFGVATPRNSPLRDPINVAVLKLKEEGTLYTLHQKWWVEKGQCGGAHQSKQKGKLSLTLSNVAGIFYILIVGLVVAIVLGVFELMCFRARKKEKVLLREERLSGDGFLRGTNTLTTLCNTPNDREDGMLPYDSRRQTPEPPILDGEREKYPDTLSRRLNSDPPDYIGFEKFQVDIQAPYCDKSDIF